MEFESPFDAEVARRGEPSEPRNEENSCEHATWPVFC
jgi:hypothetical protein